MNTVLRTSSLRSAARHTGLLAVIATLALAVSAVDTASAADPYSAYRNYGQSYNDPYTSTQDYGRTTDDRYRTNEYRYDDYRHDDSSHRPLNDRYGNDPYTSDRYAPPTNSGYDQEWPPLPDQITRPRDYSDYRTPLDSRDRNYGRLNDRYPTDYGTPTSEPYRDRYEDLAAPRPRRSRDISRNRDRYEDRYPTSNPTRYEPTDSDHLTRYRPDNRYLDDRNLDPYQDRYDNRYQDRYQPRTTPTPAPITPAPRQEPTGAELVNLRITSRYQNPVVLRFTQSVSAQQAVNLFNETSRLIDTRHLNPTSYEARTRQALTNLSAAVENPAFRQANRINPSATQVRAFRDGLNRYAATGSIRNATDASNAMQGVMSHAQSTLGLSPTVVAMEFVYGSAESLDKYSTFNPDDVYRRPSASSLDESVVGIGVEIKPHDDGVVVIKALRGGPAAAAGLQPGDVIVSVNGQRLRGQSLDFVVDQITGQVGTRVQLELIREGRTVPATLTRQNVQIHSVSEVKMLANDVGYIRLDKFAQNSMNEVDQALWSLHRQGMKSLVFDVRGNPGGLLTTAIELSNKFLPAGNIVSTRGRTASDQMSESANYEQTWKTPLVVLVDGDSASASEIFAAAIQENRRGVLIGRDSYGKGTVQTHFPLQSVAGNLKLTTAKFYSPNGREMAGAGVKPDVYVSRAQDDYATSNQNDRDIQKALSVATSSQLQELANAAAGNRTGVQTLPALN